MTKPKKLVNPAFDPFARATDLGESTDIEDTKEQDDKKIEGFVPTDASTDEGYKRMLEILGKKEPEQNEVSVKYGNTVTNKEATKSNTENVFDEVKSTSKNEKTFENVSSKSNTENVFTQNDKQDSTSVEHPSKPSFTDEDVLPLLDSIITKGYASETYYIRGAKVALRSQFFWEDQRIVELTDMSSRDITLRATTTFYFQVYALAANLEEFGGNYFKPLNRGSKDELNENFGKRVQFLLGLPSVLVNHLYNLRNKFVEKMQYLNDHFDALLKAF